ncbi:MAG: prepilin peptidase [Pseudomonadota bacterium]
MSAGPVILDGVWMAGLAGVLGACIGSFLATCCFRLVPAEASAYGQGPITLIAGRSVCRFCARRLTARDLVPVISWLARRGRCACGRPIGAVYPVVEAGSALAFLLAAAALEGVVPALAVGLLGSVLLALAVVDVRHLVLPDPLVASVAAIALALTALGGTAISFADAGLGALGGGGLLWGLRDSYWRLRGLEGLGLGDVKLAAAAGLWVGWQGLGEFLLLAAALTLIAACVRALRGAGIGRGTRIPFGPGLAAGLYLVVLGAPQRLLSIVAAGGM